MSKTAAWNVAVDLQYTAGELEKSAKSLATCISHGTDKEVKDELSMCKRRLNEASQELQELELELKEE